jgi:hypothetical protein
MNEILRTIFCNEKEESPKHRIGQAYVLNR